MKIEKHINILQCSLTFSVRYWMQIQILFSSVHLNDITGQGAYQM